MSGRVGLVTGATGGVGSALVRRLVNNQVHVIAIGRDKVRLGLLRSQFPERVDAIVADLSSSCATKALIDTISQRFPNLSILINSAGVQVEADYFRGSTSELIRLQREEVDINLAAPMALCVGLLNVLADQNGAAIVNVTSGLALAPVERVAGYAATKSALRFFTKALRYQCERHAPHICVSDIVLGRVDTPMTHGQSGSKQNALDVAVQIVECIRNRKTEFAIGQGISALLELANERQLELDRRLRLA